MTLIRPEVFDRVRFWSAGSLQGRSFEEVSAVLPFLAVGLVLALLLPRALNAMALGEEAAVALGAHPGVTRLVGLLGVTLLCGAATAAAGPLSFIGLMVPHALRILNGPDHRWLIPLSALAAPVLVLTADILARVVVAAELACRRGHGFPRRTGADLADAAQGGEEPVTMGPSTSQQSPAVTTVSTHSASPLFRQGLRPVRIAGFSGTVDGRTLLHHRGAPRGGCGRGLVEYDQRLGAHQRR